MLPTCTTLYSNNSSSNSTAHTVNIIIYCSRLLFPTEHWHWAIIIWIDENNFGFLCHFRYTQKSVGELANFAALGKTFRKKTTSFEWKFKPTIHVRIQIQMKISAQSNQYRVIGQTFKPSYYTKCELPKGASDKIRLKMYVWTKNFLVFIFLPQIECCPRHLPVLSLGKFDTVREQYRVIWNGTWREELLMSILFDLYNLPCDTTVLFGRTDDYFIQTICLHSHWI